MAKFYLRPEFFTDGRRVVFRDGDELCAETFRYSSGIEALCISNSRGSFTVLPFMGQMVWRCDFDGRELTMRSIFDEPQPCRASFEESYGCFLMHCGLTAMGNPTAADSHPPHGELPFARYGEAWLEYGRDSRGPWLAAGGTYAHRRSSAIHYGFTPRILLRPRSTALEIEVRIENRKDLPLEYYYLCHMNHLPVDGARIVESPASRPPSPSPRSTPPASPSARQARASATPAAA